MKSRCWIGSAALLGALTVALGAFGAHALEERLTPEELATWQTAVLYMGLHAPAIALHALWRQVGGGGSALPAALFAIGVLAFSGSLFAHVLGGPRALVFVTPAGGSALILGWLAWAWQAFRAPGVGSRSGGP